VGFHHERLFFFILAESDLSRAGAATPFPVHIARDAPHITLSGGLRDLLESRIVREILRQSQDDFTGKILRVHVICPQSSPTNLTQFTATLQSRFAFVMDCVSA
jgi:hypothetical protein